MAHYVVGRQVVAHLRGWLPLRTSSDDSLTQFYPKAVSQAASGHVHEG